MNALGYIRRSAKSEGSTISLEEQEAKIREYCAAQGFSLAGVVRHDGISGTKRRRFDEIERVIVSSRIHYLVVYHLDRLARDVEGLMGYCRSLARRQIEVHEVGFGRIDLTKPSGFILTAVKGAFDELYPLIIGEKTADALRRKKSQGRRYTNLPPFGFQYVEGLLVVDAAEQAALRIIEGCAGLGLGARRARAALPLDYYGRRGLGTIHRALKIARVSHATPAIIVPTPLDST